MLHEHTVVELLRMGPHRGQGGCAVVQREVERVADHPLHGSDQLARQPPARDDAPQRQRPIRRPLPARAQILDKVQALRLPREATLVDADAEIGAAIPQPRHDLGEDDMLDPRRVRMEHREEQRRRRALARAERQLRGVAGYRARLGREQQRAHPEPERRTARQHDDVARDGERRGEARLAHVEVASREPRVERLDVEQ